MEKKHPFSSLHLVVNKSKTLESLWLLVKEVCLGLQESVCLREVSAIGRCPLREVSLYITFIDLLSDRSQRHLSIQIDAQLLQVVHRRP